MDRKRKAAADEGTLKTQRPLPRQHRDRERRALESVEAGTIQQSPLPSLEQPWVQQFSAAIEEVYAMPDIGPDDDAQEAQRVLQHQHRERQRRALEGAEDKARRLQQCQQMKRTERVTLFDTIQQSPLPLIIGAALGARVPCSY